jgi:tetratricopeptide (TPR) repeat protein
MRRHYFLLSFIATVMLLLSSVVASAQTGQLYGEVTIKQADGSIVPAAGVAIDVYRTDIPAKYNTKTDKKGKFVFAGLPFVGTYVIAASAPNAAPYAMSGVKAGRDVNYKLELAPGDGKRYTEAEAKAASGGGGGGSSNSGAEAPKESPEARKKREELESKNKEIMAQNEKNTKINDVINRTFKAGNEALSAKRYDDAIAQYDEGLAADAEQPALLTNKSIALRSRGVDRFNAAVKLTDDAAKNAGIDAAKKDFKDAAELSGKAIELIKAQPTPTDPEALKSYNGNKYFTLFTRAEAMRLFVSKVDPTQADAGVTAYQEYIAVETDPAKKIKAQTDMAQMLLDAGQADKAYAEFAKALNDDPENVDALLGAGLSLFATGDKAKYQDAANYLQRFVDKAPDTHRFKADAKSTLDFLKTQENIKPQKTTTTTGGRRRG